MGNMIGSLTLLQKKVFQKLLRDFERLQKVAFPGEALVTRLSETRCNDVDFLDKALSALEQTEFQGFLDKDVIKKMIRLADLTIVLVADNVQFRVSEEDQKAVAYLKTLYFETYKEKVF